MKKVDQDPHTLIIFYFIYSTDEICEWAPLNFGTIAHINVTYILNDTIFIAPASKPFDNVRPNRSIHAVESHGLRYTPRPIDALPRDGIF